MEDDVKEVLEETSAPKYILRLGAPVTHRWKDKNGVKQSRTYPVGTEMMVLFPFKTRRRRGGEQKWADCMTEDGIVLTIGHNKKHHITQISELPIDNPTE